MGSGIDSGWDSKLDSPGLDEGSGGASTSCCWLGSSIAVDEVKNLDCPGSGGPSSFSASLSSDEDDDEEDS